MKRAQAEIKQVIKYEDLPEIQKELIWAQMETFKKLYQEAETKIIEVETKNQKLASMINESQQV